ncbi:MAG: hypothetical protein J5912_05760 [Clostridia bacterium]|nr:hypothetical protein [Clostridia bacterium]
MDHNIEFLTGYVEKNGIEALVTTGEYAVNLQYENLLRVLDAGTKSLSEYVGVIFVAGPSASGKTTFSKRLSDKIRSTGVNVSLLSLDNFYHDSEYTKNRQVKMGLIPPGSNDVDYECVDAFDVSKFKSCVQKFIAGETVMLPKFDFMIGKQIQGAGGKIVRKGKDLLIVEGIQTMNPKIFKGFSSDFKYKIYICPFDSYSFSGSKARITPQSVRFMRRTNRDFETRNADILRTLEMWPSVRNGEEKYIKPQKKYADYFFNSSYVYEIFYLCSKIAEMAENLTEEERKTVSTVIPIDAIAGVKSVRELKLPQDSVFNEFYFG